MFHAYRMYQYPGAQKLSRNNFFICVLNGVSIGVVLKQMSNLRLCLKFVIFINFTPVVDIFGQLNRLRMSTMHDQLRQLVRGGQGQSGACRPVPARVEILQK